ncbi:hypothetical protein F4803DRAFT_506877 [Xylaria telfairii]|nr:hypothetical protein F4803DRAFT_506877 [Xylaria telfairii]
MWASVGMGVASPGRVALLMLLPCARVQHSIHAADLIQPTAHTVHRMCGWPQTAPCSLFLFPLSQTPSSRLASTTCTAPSPVTIRCHHVTQRHHAVRSNICSLWGYTDPSDSSLDAQLKPTR